MRYLELSDEAKENALNDYCDLMQIAVKTQKEEVILWFAKYNRDVFTEDGFLKHRKNR